MNSMTGYGRATAALGSHTLTVQVSSVNRKTLDLTVALPRDWESLEPEVAAKVRQGVVRGKVHVDVELTGRPNAVEAKWSEESVAQNLDQLRTLAAKQGMPFAPTAELLWQIASGERQPVQFPTVEASRPAVMAALGEALQSFVTMRAREGTALQADLLERLAALERELNAVSVRAPQVPGLYRELLFKRLREAGLELLDLGDERVLKEIALFADRCDVSEELTRLRSHLSQLGQLLRADGEIGRKAEFILQEIGRESHTIGSKANDLAIAKAVIEFKNELERIREQIANVE
jgi:uncharacterized protein (TIGR00255 family)